MSRTKIARPQRPTTTGSVKHFRQKKHTLPIFITLSCHCGLYYILLFTDFVLSRYEFALSSCHMLSLSLIPQLLTNDGDAPHACQATGSKPKKSATWRESKWNKQVKLIELKSSLKTIQISTKSKATMLVSEFHVVTVARFPGQWSLPVSTCIGSGLCKSIKVSWNRNQVPMYISSAVTMPVHTWRFVSTCRDFAQDVKTQPSFYMHTKSQIKYVYGPQYTETYPSILYSTLIFIRCFTLKITIIYTLIYWYAPLHIH